MDKKEILQFEKILEKNNKKVEINTRTIIKDEIESNNNKLEKRMKFVVCEGISELVLPRLQNLEDGQEILKNDVKILKNDVKILKDDTKYLKEDSVDKEERLDIMNKKLDATVKITDLHDQGIFYRFYALDIYKLT